MRIEFTDSKKSGVHQVSCTLAIESKMVAVKDVPRVAEMLRKSIVELCSEKTQTGFNVSSDDVGQIVACLAMGLPATLTAGQCKTLNLHIRELERELKELKPAP